MSIKPTDYAEQESKIQLDVPILKVTQPLGEFFIASMSCKDLLKITEFDHRQLIEGGTIEEYIGIQRKVTTSRVNEIREFVDLPDAFFPTSVVIHIDPPYVQVKSKSLLISNKPFEGNSPNRTFRSLGRILDGQHRLKGLEQALAEKGDLDFDLIVTIFTGLDLSDQAMIFANVNLSHVKVNRSLAHDLQSMNKYNSPQRFCHLAVVALNKSSKSPFYRLIKRLGTKTPDVQGETLNQAVFVESLLKHISPRKRLMKDVKYGKEYFARHILKKKFPSEDGDDEDLVLRKFYERSFYDQDSVVEFTQLLMNYFNAVKNRWTKEWDSNATGIVIKKGNGLQAFMRFFPYAYKSLADKSGDSISTEKFDKFFSEIDLTATDFTTDKAVHGKGGETYIFNRLLDQSNVDENIKFRKN